MTHPVVRGAWQAGGVFLALPLPNGEPAASVRSGSGNSFARGPAINEGFTLLEVMMSLGILVVVMGVLFGLAASLGDSAKVQEAKVTATDESRNAMTALAREGRQAATGSVNWGNLPGSVLTYQVAADVDGNGTAVDVNGNLELSALRTLSRDLSDANSDGLTVTQLVLTSGTTVRVLTNGLLPDEDLNGNGALDAGEDGNSNGMLDRGLWFEQAGNGIRITVQAQRRSGANGPLMTSTLVETVVPRN